MDNLAQYTAKRLAPVDSEWMGVDSAWKQKKRPQNVFHAELFSGLEIIFQFPRLSLDAAVNRWARFAKRLPTP